MLRIHRLRIQNFKGIDDLELSFPLPELPGDPDAFVLGSRNGIGKTSVLEALSLGIWFHQFATDADATSLGSPGKGGLDPFVRAGTNKFDLSLEGGSPSESWHVACSAGSSPATYGPAFESPESTHKGTWFARDIERIRGRDPNPVLLPGLLHFTGFRRVLDGELSMQDLGEGSGTNAHSAFKAEASLALIGSTGLFEDFGSADWALRLRQINILVDRYAGGAIEKLAPNLQGSLRLRIRAHGSGASHDFDGLSSGQKEIISTLYLIWRHTRDNPSVVLIDEPELHLNAEWRVDYLRTLHRMAPRNQYILATHSEDIFASVDPSRRFVLNPAAVLA